jgi:hypothetical protein
MFALLIGRASALMIARTNFRVAMWSVLIMLVAVGMLPSTFGAMRSRIPVGGDHGAHDGIDQAAAYLSTLPVGTVVYYDSLGWTLSYYLFDAYVVPVGFASPSALESDLAAFRGSGESRYLILPGWISHQEVMGAVASAGYESISIFKTSNRYGDRSFVIYRLDPEG